MTVQEQLEQKLIECGMFNHQAKEVVALAIPEISKITDNYQITWNSPSDNYPEAIYSVLFMTVKPIALKWIEEHAPMAWFKPMFK